MKIGLLGYGTVGRGVYDILKEGGAHEVVKILRRKQNVPEGDGLFTADPNEVLLSDDIDLVVEVMGGDEPAFTYMKTAMQAGKHVVTANKQAVAEHLPELHEIARKNGVKFAYEASCGGGIPFLKALCSIAEFDTIHRVNAIVNGTTNYVLTEMGRGQTFDGALESAKLNGFAEADPSADLSGADSVRKLAIMASLAYHTYVEPSNIYARGLYGVSKEFTSALAQNGYVLKYMAQAALYGDEVSLSVQPVAVPSDSPFASVNDEFNAVEISAERNGRLFFSGKGAGRYPTASAVVSDIVDISRGADGMEFTAKKGVTPSKTVEKGDYFVFMDGSCVKTCGVSCAEACARGFAAKILK